MINRNADVLWLVEHVARELDAACIVKAMLESRFQISVQICQLNRDYKIATRLMSPRLVVFPFFYRRSDPGVKPYCDAWPEARFMNLAWEELFYGANSDFKRPADDFARQSVHFHAWGDFYKEYLLQSSVDPAHIFVNGNPAFQLYFKPYRRYFKTREQIAAENGLDPTRRWILIPENYRWAFIPDESIEDLRGRNADTDEISRLRIYCRKALRELIQWCAEAAKAGDFELILRPRPATTLAEFQAFAAEVVNLLPGNMHIIQSDSVREWILASDVVMSSYSTTLIEAALVEKPIFMVETLPVPASLTCDWHSLIECITTKKEFLEVCASKKAQEKIQEEVPEKTIDDLLGNFVELKEWACRSMLDHGDVFEGLATYVAGLVKEGPTVQAQSNHSAIKFTNNLNTSGLKITIKAALKEFKRKLLRQQTHSIGFADDFKQNEVDLKVRRWSQFL